MPGMYFRKRAGSSRLSDVAGSQLEAFYAPFYLFACRINDCCSSLVIVQILTTVPALFTQGRLN